MAFQSFPKPGRNHALPGQDRKIGNQQTLCQLNHSHRSKLEANVCALIQQRERAHDLVLDQVEDHIYLTDARIGYIPDFRCHDPKTLEKVWVEAKGFENDRWPMKKKLWKFYGPGKLEIWKSNNRGLYLDETVIPVHREICPTCGR